MRGLSIQENCLFLEIDVSRQLITAMELQRIIQTEVDAVPEIRKDFARIAIHTPMWREPEDDEANWSVDYDGEAMYSRAIGIVVNRLQRQYDLNR